jgi:hypothetical protein
MATQRVFRVHQKANAESPCICLSVLRGNNTLSLPSNTAIYYKIPRIRVRSLQSFSITTCFGPSTWPPSGLYVSSEGDYITSYVISF